MKEFTFDFKDINSSVYGVYLINTPYVTRPEMDVTAINIDGVNGGYFNKLGYKPYEKRFELIIKFNTKDRVEQSSYIYNEIVSWLSGEGDLIVFNEPDKKYTAYCYKSIEFTKESMHIWKAEVYFTVQPVKKSVSDELIEYELTDNAVQIINGGNIKCRPVMQITGTGNVDVMVNNVLQCTLAFGDTERTLELNGELQECFYDGNLANRSMTGDFPALNVGNNIITFLGTVSSLKLRKNEGWI